MIFFHNGSAAAFEEWGPGLSSQQWGKDFGFLLFMIFRGEYDVFIQFW